MRDVLRIARQVSEWTDGKFDVTFGALTDVWKFDQDQDDTVPSPEADPRAAAAHRLSRQIEIDDRAGTAFLKRKGMRIHLGGIGKGYAVEQRDRDLPPRRAARFHDPGRRRSLRRRHAGTIGRGGWGSPIRAAGDGHSFATVELTDSTFSTSGDYERFFIKDGVRYHHILDLPTGQPARLCRSVTIVADSPVLADAARERRVHSRARTKGMALIERLPRRRRR